MNLHLITTLLSIRVFVSQNYLHFCSLVVIKSVILRSMHVKYVGDINTGSNKTRSVDMTCVAHIVVSWLLVLLLNQKTPVSNPGNERIPSMIASLTCVQYACFKPWLWN
jgi:hypothetical protein